MAHKGECFGHIYYDDWEIGFECERRIKGKVEYLGEVISKELAGSPYDPEIVITFSKNGEKYKHYMVFDHSYMLKMLLDSQLWTTKLHPKFPKKCHTNIICILLAANRFLPTLPIEIWIDYIFPNLKVIDFK